MTDEERLAATARADVPYPILERHLADIIGHKLFTLMVIDREAQEAARIYSSHPDAYPIKGRKPLGDLTAWGQQVIARGQPFIGRTADDIKAVFPDHETIASLGCASVLNLPVIADSATIGTVNLMHEADWYTDAHAVRGAPFAALLVAHFDSWTSRSSA